VQGITVGGVTPEASLSPSKTLSSSQKLSASQLVSAPLSSGTSLLGDKDNADVVRAAIGIELASMLSSDGWQERQKGLWALAQAIVGGKVPLIPKATPPFWETILGVIKSALLDPASQVNVAVFDVVLAVTPDIEACQVGSSSTSKLVIPWDLWDVQLPLGSLVKTLFGKLGDIRRRVVDVTRRIIVRLAQVNKNCLAVITKALCATIALPSGNSIASTLGMRAVLAVTTRLRVLADVLECPVVASGTYSVPFEALLKWLTPLMTTNVKTVGQLAKYCAEMLLTGPDADQGEYATAISTFLSSCDPGTREYLDAAMTGSSRDGHVGDFGVAGFGLAISAADNSGMSARSDFSHTARSVDSNGSWEGLGVTGSATAGSQMAPSGIRSVSPTFVIQPAIRSPLVPPGSPIVHNPLGSPTGASSPLRRPTQPHRRVDSAGPSSSAFGHDGGSTGIALSGEPARRVPLAGRRALSAKVCFAFPGGVLQLVCPSFGWLMCLWCIRMYRFPHLTVMAYSSPNHSRTLP
jgi:citrate lyase gamma subunit